MYSAQDIDAMSEHYNYGVFAFEFVHNVRNERFLSIYLSVYLHTVYWFINNHIDWWYSHVTILVQIITNECLHTCAT